MNDGTTAAALQHRFRPIKKEAEAMNAGSQLHLLFPSLAPHHPSMHSAPFHSVLLYHLLLSPPPLPVINRLTLVRTFANYFIAIAGQYGDGVNENGSAKKTPIKRTPAGGKRKAAAIKGEDGDDDESMAETPSKKAKSARGGAKATPKRGPTAKTINYQETSDVDDEEGLSGRIKPEKVEESEEDIGAAGYGNGHVSQYAGNGNGNGNGYHNGHSNGYTVSHDNDGFEDDDNFAGQDMYFEANEDEA
ncbi:hypothetical protein DL98DRAFT_260030 [Cadophora sp. DSE1049]|nr:hypothetical protein DL98DRAFT_260030 [Cadophora sp. DSE1049]